MTTANMAGGASALAADYINPIISATRSVFEMMLGCTPTRTGLFLKQEGAPYHEVSAVIGVSGRATGTIVVSLSREAACRVLERMVGIESEEINREVCDAVGELTNMIAGSAKAQLSRYELSISLPNVLSGKGHVVHFPSEIQPIVVTFDSEIGPLTIEAGFSGL